MTVEEMMREITTELEQFKKRHASELEAQRRMLEGLQAKANRRGPTVEVEPENRERGEHEKAFDRFLRKGVTEDLIELQTKGMSVGSDPDGGYAVPEALDREIGKVERNATPVRQLARVLTVANETYEKLMSLGGMDAGWVDEDDARTETDTATLASVKPYFGEVYANPAVTQKLLDDAFFDVGQFVSEEVGTTFAEFENAAFISGDGTKKPKGILAYPINAAPTFGQLKQVKSGAAGLVVPEKLIEVVHTLKPKYRANGSWLMASTTLMLIRQLKDANDRFLWQESLAAGQPSQLLGFPVYECEDMPAAAADAHAIVFGDFQRGYYVCDVRGVRILRDPYTNKPKVHFYTTKRLGGGVVDSNALIVHTLAA